ncbi:Gfo/Idh/MocA family protein [Ekhidna sp. To15]|uniref:Gfo/Idh/MocA family protein n=1 Tax=Ekhidna sp. To15 TaxID=3395267 RepID=UPI003F526F95
MNQLEKKLGVALLGLGSFNTTQVTTAIQSSANCELRGVITGTPVKASMWMRKYGLDKDNVYNYDNLEEIANNDSIDIVYVSVPNSKHLEFVCRAAKSKKHIICEKPLGLNISECAEMISVCEQNNVRLSIGYRLCYDPYFDFIKTIGEKEGIQELDGNLSFDLASMTDWRLDKRLSGGGALMDIGIYGIYSACYISKCIPKFVEARIHTNNTSAFKEVEESVSFTLYFETFEAKFESSYSDNQNWLKIKTEKSEYVLNNAFALSGQALTNGVELINFPDTNQIANHLDDFALSIIRNSEIKVPGNYGLRDLAIIEALYCSAKSGNHEPVKYEKS